MKIQIEFKKQNEEVVNQFSLTPEEYFDPLEEDEVKFAFDSVPKTHSLEKYTKTSPDQLDFVKLELTDPDNKVTVTQSIRFQGSEDQYLSWNKMVGPVKTSEEMISSSIIESKPTKIHHQRIEINNGIPMARNEKVFIIEEDGGWDVIWETNIPY